METIQLKQRKEKGRGWGGPDMREEAMENHCSRPGRDWGLLP